MCENWEELENEIKECTKCKLSKVRKNIVFSEGNKEAEIMLIGEMITAEQESKSEILVGKTGKLLENALQVVGIKKEKLYITNIVKCRTPANRSPEKDEYLTCIQYLRNQVMLVKPKVIILIGENVAKMILGNDVAKEIQKIDNMVEGNIVESNIVEKKGIKYLCIENPVELIRDENKKIGFIKKLELIKGIV